MKNLFISLSIALFAVVSLSGCAKQPVSMTQEVDNRPTVSFSYSDEAIADYSLYIDGANYGQVEDYMHPERSVRVIPGAHLIEVRNGETVIFTTEVHYSENTHYTVKVIQQ